MGQNNPPLSKQLMAFPLLFLDLDFPVNQEAWNIGHDSNGEYSSSFFFKNRVSHEKIILVARSVPVILSCLLAILIFIWAKMLWDEKAAFAALITYCAWPAVIAYSSVAQTDMAISLFFFFSIFSFWRFLNEPNKKTFFLLALSTGFAFATKVTAILLPPIQFLINSLQEKSFFNKRLFYLSCAWFLALFILILDYGVLGVGRYVDTFRWVMGNTLGIRESHVYFFGKTYLSHPLYYLVVFLLKNPIPILIFSFLGIVLNWRKKESLFLLIPIALFFLSASRSKIQLGERFILPIYPFLCLFAGHALSIGFTHSNKIFKFGTLLLFSWLIASNTKTYPYYLSYVNEFGGGPNNSWKTIGFIEGGQDVKGVYEFWQSHPNSTLIRAFNMSEIIDWVAPNHPTRTEKVFLALGVSSFGEKENGLKRGSAQWFLKNRTPIKQLGSIWVYDITQDKEASNFTIPNQ